MNPVIDISLIVMSQDLMTNVLPLITTDNFTQLKAWITANFDAAKQAMGTDVLGTYDKDSPPSTLGALTDANGGLLDDLPSTATWLMNKVIRSYQKFQMFFIEI